MTETVLFVDDEPAALDGYHRMLYRDFQVKIAVGGEQGLAAIQEHGPFSVVVSDMQMPGMNGAQFLAQVREKTPDTVKMLLTGYTDLDAAIEAVNEGNIFRFLTKPCKKETLAAAISAGLVQYRLVTAEKELLENTLMGSIKVLADVLGAVCPEAFSRSMRISRYVLHIAGKTGLPHSWRIEAAAVLSQLGCVTLDPGLIQAAYMGAALSPDEQARFDAHPQAGSELIAKIPRMEAVGWMINQQAVKEIPEEVPGGSVEDSQQIVLGCKILKLAVAFENLKQKKMSDEDAIMQLRRRHDEFEAKLVDTLRDFKHGGATMIPRRISASRLAVGMILQQEIKNSLGVLVVAKGQEVTRPLLNKLENFSRAGTIDKEIMVLVPM